MPLCMQVHEQTNTYERSTTGEMPLCNNMNSEPNSLQLEEERRLCYVAMTRARFKIDRIESEAKKANVTDG